MLISLTGFAAQATTVTCTASEENYDVSLVLNFVKNDGTYKMSITKNMDEYDTYCDTPGSCPVRADFIRNLTATSQVYEFTSCDFNTQEGLADCWGHKTYSRLQIYKNEQTTLKNGYARKSVFHTLELVSDQLTGEHADLLYPWELQGRSLELNLSKCEVTQ